MSVEIRKLPNLTETLSLNVHISKPGLHEEGLYKDVGLEVATKYMQQEEITPIEGVCLANPTTVATLIIPAYNESHQIRKTLDAVGRSTLPIEVVVVDNASKDDTASIVKTAVPQVNFPLTLLKCDYPGAGNARKTGADQVVASVVKNGLDSSRIILFTDGDTDINSEFAAAAQKSLIERHISGGLFKFPDWLDEKIYESFGIQDCFNSVSDLASKLCNQGLAYVHTNGTNMAMDVQAYSAVGGSKEMYGEKGERIKGQDRAMGIRARQIGLDIGFIPTVNVASPRRVLFTLLRNVNAAQAYEGSNGVRYPHGDDSQLLSAALKRVPKERWQAEHDNRLKYLLINGVVLPVVKGVQPIEPLEKLLGSGHPLVDKIHQLQQRPDSANESSAMPMVEQYKEDMLKKLDS